jgi:hypothetical protein
MDNKHFKRTATMINLDEYPHLNRGDVERLKESFYRRDKEGHGFVYQFDIVDVLRGKLISFSSDSNRYGIVCKPLDQEESL